MKNTCSISAFKENSRRIFLFLSLIFISVNLLISGKLYADGSQESALSTNVGNLSQCQDPTSSLLWSIKNGESTVYLFGSIHIGAKNFYPLHQKIEDIFRSSDHLVFEISPASLTDPANTIEVQARSLYPENQTLEDHVSPATVNNVKSALNNFGLPANAYMGYRPWFITLLLTNMQMISMGYMPQYGVEQYLFREKSENTDVLELETFRSQLDLMESLDGEAFLAYTLANLDKGKKSIRELISAWKCSDKDALSTMFAEEFEADGPLQKQIDELEDNLLYKRNTIMADGIENFLTEGKGTYFVVVGTAHYLGEKSVIQKLIDKKYKVTPISL